MLSTIQEKNCARFWGNWGFSGLRCMREQFPGGLAFKLFDAKGVWASAFQRLALRFSRYGYLFPSKLHDSAGCPHLLKVPFIPVSQPIGLSLIEEALYVTIRISGLSIHWSIPLPSPFCHSASHITPIPCPRAPVSCQRYGFSSTKNS